MERKFHNSLSTGQLNCCLPHMEEKREENNCMQISLAKGGQRRYMRIVSKY